jgi:cytochrome c oxidase subunit 2
MLRRSCARAGWKTLAFSLVCAFVPVGAAHAADAAAGKAAYAVCAACHGQQGEGNQAMNAPRLAGQHDWYVKRQLEAFRNGYRGTAAGDTNGMQMRQMAMAVADPTAVDNLIAFIAALPDTPAAPTIKGDAAAGKASYGVCAACHGANGEGNEQLGGPRLAGQDDWYLVRQIQAFQQGHRGYDAKDTYGLQMKPMAATLPTAQAINDVVAYINTLR